MPKPELQQRIKAFEYPEKSYTTTQFDEPKRKDVLQTEIPQMTTRTTEEVNDPRYPKKRAVEKVHGTVYHGTGSTDPAVVFGTNHSLLEKKSKKKSKKRDINQVRNLRDQGLHHAKEAYRNSDVMLDSIQTHSGNKLIMDVKTTNKAEHNDLNLHENNQYRKDRINWLKRTPLGVKAAHTLRRLP